MRKRSEIGKPAAAPTSAETPAPTLGSVECPSCHLVQPTGTSDCIACGTTLTKMIVKEGPPVSKEERPDENLGKLAYDLKNKDIDITLAQLCSMLPSDRRELQKWVDARSADVPPRVRMILERLNELKVKPLAGPGSDTPEPPPRHVGIDRASGNDKTNVTNIINRFATDGNGEEVTYVLGKEMYRVADFCTFDVGPYSATTRIREDETRVDALNRLRVELEAMAEIDRVARRDSYIRTMLGIKPAVKKASDSIKE